MCEVNPFSFVANGCEWRVSSIDPALITIVYFLTPYYSQMINTYVYNLWDPLVYKDNPVT